MLDIMRRRKRLRLILWLVIAALALSMLVFFVPGVDRAGQPGSATEIATVDGNPIPVQHFSNVYRRILNEITGGRRDEIEPETLRAMGFHYQVLDSLINAEITQVVARRFGIKVTADEIRRAVESHPSLQFEGSFIGVNQYKALLAQNYISVVDFENDIRRMETEKKLRTIITDSLAISEEELRREFAANHQNTVVDFVFLKKEDYRQRVSPADTDLEAWFDTRRDNYRVEEKRRARYLLVPVYQFLSEVVVTEQELLDEWNKFPQTEMVEAAHILFIVNDMSQDAEVREKAEAVLKMAQAGRRFAELAELYSEDPGSADQGGYLGPFQRGQMVGEFEEAAFSLNPGELSGLVRTEYGYHIIYVIDRETPTLESNRAMLTDQIRQRKSNDLAQQKAEEAAALAAEIGDLNLVVEKLAAAAELRGTELFERNDNPFDFGISRALLEESFGMQEVKAFGKVTEHPQGFAVPELMEIQPARTGTFDEFSDQVRRDYVEVKTDEVMQAEAENLSMAAAAQGSLEKAARTMGMSARRSQEFTVTGIADPEIGASTAFNQAVFSLEPGDVSMPQPVLGNLVVFQVVSRTPFDDAAFEEQKPGMKEAMLQTLRNQFFNEYIQKVREELERRGKIEIKTRVLEQATMYF